MVSNDEEWSQNLTLGNVTITSVKYCTDEIECLKSLARSRIDSAVMIIS